MINGEPHFVAKDIAIALEYSTSSTQQISNLISNIPEEWKGINPINTLGGDQDMYCLTEQGLYFFINRSDKPKAIPFQKWVASDVLPTIRKTGSYSISIPKSLPDALRLYANELEMKELVIKQRDEAIRTKAQIGSKREATAMAHTSVLKKENEKLKTQIGNSERYKQVTAILWLKEFFHTKEKSFHSQVGTQLSRLSTKLEIATIYVESIKYDKVKAYDIDVINYFKQQLMEDTGKTIMTKYRLN